MFPLVHEPIGLDELKTELSANVDSLKKAKVWEIWSKPERKVYWRAEQFPQNLDEKDDPLQLEGFFPCPKPVYATLTSDTLIPVPDYTEYQDQARELDELTQRISMLTKACKVVGCMTPVRQRLSACLRRVDNTLIPVDTWAAFAEKGGTVGAVQFLPSIWCSRRCSSSTSRVIPSNRRSTRSPGCRTSCVGLLMRLRRPRRSRSRASLQV